MSQNGKESLKAPVLFVDVDGVLSVFGFPTNAPAPGSFHSVDGIPHCLAHGCGDRLNRLSDSFELVWATGWEDRANERLPGVLGLPGELPFLTFDGNARFGSAHWKIDAIDRYAGDRRLAWVDDCIDETCQAWAIARSAPTLLVPTESDVGLTDKHLTRLLNWARAGYTA